MFGSRPVLDEAAIQNEVLTLARNIPILVGRDARVPEVGLALGVFLYWRLGFLTLSGNERRDSALKILNDCRYCVHVLYRRLAANGLTPPIPDSLVESHIESEIEEVDSMLGCVNQTSHIFAESYLVTTDQWPVMSSWERMPGLACLNMRSFSKSVLRLIGLMCSPAVAEAILPIEVVDSAGGLSRYGSNIVNGFLIRRRR
jgi:hypothetical protein